MNNFLKPKIKELALKHKLTQTQINDIFYSQFKHAAKVISEDSALPEENRRSIKIKGLGTFQYNMFKAKKMTKVKKEKENARKNMVEASSQD